MSLLFGSHFDRIDKILIKVNEGGIGRGAIH
jgi:hypothetical protein